MKSTRKGERTVLTGEVAVNKTIITQHVMTAAGHLNILEAEAYESGCV